MISTCAQLGRDARYPANSKRSMSRRRRVSDSFLKPVMTKGELSKVSVVDIIGDVYVRIAGREEIAKVSLEELRSSRDTIKLPAVSCRKQSQKIPISRLFLVRGNSSSMKAAYGWLLTMPICVRSTLPHGGASRLYD
jgi:hypothetical protein